MRIVRVLLLVVVAVTFLASVSPAEQLLSQSSVARAGLTRSWFTQIGSPRSTGAVAHLNCDQGMLYVQTTRGNVSALDAETGRMLWSAQVGSPNHVSSEPDGNKNILAVVSGSTLYVLDRHSGALLWQRLLNGTPGAGPCVTATTAYVPMVNGFVQGYNLEKKGKGDPWNYKSAGRVLVPPTATGDSVVWTTEKGYMYVADAAAGGVLYRLETRDAIQARPAYWTPRLYACSTDGNVYAVNEATGKIVWRFTIGDAIYAQPVALEDKVFVISEQTGMYCLAGQDGAKLWHAAGITQFVSLSQSRVYAVDELERLIVLDAESGARLGLVSLDRISIKLVNRNSDRIYLASESGIVQCLHEVSAKSPKLHVPPPLDKTKAIKAKPKQSPKQPKSDEELPADEPAEEMPAEDLPADEMPAEDAATDSAPDAPADTDGDNPFK